ncbi:MAG: hypothetical protein QM701_15440 [Propionivibrio sp.]
MPAVVGTAMNGILRRTTRDGSVNERARKAAISPIRSSGLAASTMAAFAASSVEPPPNATAPSHRASARLLAIISTVVVSGSPGSCRNTTQSIPCRRSERYIPSASPA